MYYLYIIIYNLIITLLTYLHKDTIHSLGFYLLCVSLSSQQHVSP